MSNDDEHDKYEAEEEESSADNIQVTYDVGSGIGSGECSSNN